MIKRLIAIAAGALFSLNASASYTQYTFGGANANVRGFIIIRDEDKSVAMFDIYTPITRFTPQDRGDGYHINRLLETTTSFTGMGPTNMYMRDFTQEDYSSQMWMMFSEGSTSESFNYSLRVLRGAGPHSPYPDRFTTLDLTYSGTATGTAASEYWTNFLDTSNQFDLPRDIPYYDPTQVPEPGSMALLAVGAFGLASLRRRRSSK